MKKKFTFYTTYDNKKAVTHVDVELTKDNCLAICGDLKVGKDYILGGQCLDDLKELPELQNNNLFNKIHRLWKLYHLNDMHAGTPKQEKALRDVDLNDYGNEFERCCEYLKSINLYEDNGYRFGSGWLKEEIPEEDLNLIKELIEED